MTTTVAIEGYAVEGTHGAQDWEREQAQLFVLSAWVELADEPTDERLTSTLDYGELQNWLHDAIAEGPPLRLLETLIERVLAPLRERADVVGARVRIEKPHAPLPRPGGLAVVERAWRRG